MAGLLSYPSTAVRPEPNSIGGIGFTDPYQWLEGDTAEVTNWRSAQNRFTTAYLRACAGWTRCRETVERLYANALWQWAPERHGDRWFRQLVPDGARLVVLEVADTPTGPGRRIVDLNTIDRGTDADALTSLVFWEPSRDGRSLAYGVSDRGEPAPVRVIDVDSGRLLLDGLEHDGIGIVTWLPDNSGFYYVVPETASSTPGVYFRHLDQDTPSQHQELRCASPPWRVVMSPAGRHALLYSVDQRPLFIRDLAIGGPWRPFLDGTRGTYKGNVVRDRFIAVASDVHPNGRVVSIPLDAPTDRTQWTELLPPSDNAVLLNAIAVGDRLVIGKHIAGVFRLVLLDPEDGYLGDIPLPGDGLAWQGPERGSLVAPGHNECTFVFSSLTRSPAAYRYDLTTRTLDELTRPKVVAGDVVVRHHTARGKDGTTIPYLVLARANVDLSSPQPTVMSAYGALANPWPPAYLFTLPAAWVQLGGVYVHAHPRGGGEFGPRWWHAARLATKQTTFDDVHAVAEDLIARGLTAPDRLGIFGTSAGSLPALAAVTQRPDLFRAAVPMLPVADLLRCRQDDDTMTAIVRPDLGDPDQPGDAAVLYGYSPYHRVEDGIGYPAVFLDCALRDPYCPAWHGMKMTARLRHATSSPHPILLRVRDCGHNTRMTPEQMRDREIEELVFFVTELGLDPLSHVELRDAPFPG